MKVWNYMAIMLSLMVFLYFIGLNPTGAGDVLNETGIQINSTTGELIEGDVADSSWYSKLFNPTDGLLFLIGVGGAIIVGLFTRQFDWKIVMLPFFTLFVGKFVSMGWSVVDLAMGTGQSWLIAVIATVFLPLTAMFVFSIIEWFGGAGTG